MEDIQKEKIPDFESLGNQFSKGISVLIFVEVQVQQLALVKAKIVGNLFESGIRFEFAQKRDVKFWHQLGYNHIPTQAEPAWWRYNAVHFQLSEYELQRDWTWLKSQNI